MVNVNYRVVLDSVSTSAVMDQIAIKVNKYIAYLQLSTFTLCGLAPITINRLNIKSQKINLSSVIFSNSRAIVAYNLILTATIFGLNVYRTFVGMLTLLDESSISLFLTGCLHYGIMWVETIILIIYCIKRSIIKNLANRLANLHVVTLKLNNIYYSKTSQYRSYVFYFVYCTISITSIIYNGVLFGDNLEYMCDELSGFYIGFVVCQYALILNIIKDRWEALNRDLTICFVRPEGQGPSKAMAYERMNQVIYRDNITDDETRLITLIRAHKILYEISREVSEFYSFSIFLAISITTYGIIVDAYWIVMDFFIKKWPIDMVDKSIISSLELAASLFPIIFLTTTVDGVTEEVLIFFSFLF